MSMLRRRAYQLTINKLEDYDKIISYLQSLKTMRYIIACKEKAPTTGKEHIHIYVQFDVGISLSKKKILTAHIEACRGTPQQNVAYIKKNGSEIIFEAGVLAKTGKLSIKEVKSLKVDEMDDLPFLYYNKVQSVKRDQLMNITASNYYKKIEVYYIYGVSGSGKTRQAIKMIQKLKEDGLIETDEFNEVKYTNNFWHGVTLDTIKEVALYDDFRDYHLPPSEFINFIDYNKHVMNVKYGCVTNSFRYIFITSIQNPEELYRESKKHEEESKQWLRRIKEIIKMEIDYQSPIPNPQSPMQIS